MIEKPYMQKLVDFTQPLAFEDTAIITKYFENYSSADFSDITIFDKISWIIFICLIINTIILLILMDKLFYIKNNNLFEQLTNGAFIMISTILGKGK